MIRRSSSLPRYLTQSQIHSFFSAISSLRDRPVRARLRLRPSGRRSRVSSTAATSISSEGGSG